MRSNGEEMIVAIDAKNTMQPPSTAVTHGISSRFLCRFCSVTSEEAPVSTVSHKSSEPGWLAHSEVSR